MPYAPIEDGNLVHVIMTIDFKPWRKREQRITPRAQAELQSGSAHGQLYLDPGVQAAPAREDPAKNSTTPVRDNPKETAEGSTRSNGKFGKSLL